MSLLQLEGYESAKEFVLSYWKKLSFKESTTHRHSLQVQNQYDRVRMFADFKSNN